MLKLRYTNITWDSVSSWASSFTRLSYARKVLCSSVAASVSCLKYFINRYEIELKKSSQSLKACHATITKLGIVLSVTSFIKKHIEDIIDQQDMFTTMFRLISDTNKLFGHKR